MKLWNYTDIFPKTHMNKFTQSVLLTKIKEPLSVNEIPNYIDSSYITGFNQKYQKMYDWMWRGYDFAEKIVEKVLYGNAIQTIRTTLMKKLEIKNACSILYVSIGTGTNLRYIPKAIDRNTLNIVGVDISLGMLRKCQQNLKKWKIQTDLLQATAESLPFKDNSFDVVFHVGGINFFTNKEKAIQEMIRVAKKGTKILIADETEDYIKQQYEKNPFTKDYFKDRNNKVIAPIDLMPKTMKDIESENLWNGKFYCITFRKP